MSARVRQMRLSARAADRPDIGRDCLQVLLRERRAAERRHHALILLGMGHALLDRRFDSRKASIAPEPPASRQRRTLGRSAAVGPVTAAARSLARLAVEDSISERDEFGARSGWDWKRT